MEHTYLRYECADSFGLVVSSASSKAPPSNSVLAFLQTTPSSSSASSAPPTPPLLLTTAGSYCVGYNLRTNLPALKLAHRQQLTGGVGTGRALNGDEIVCVDTSPASTTGGGGCRVATGWVDGAVRVFDVDENELLIGNSSNKQQLAHSLIHDNANANDGLGQREPLTLNGHRGCVRTVAFDKGQSPSSSQQDGGGGGGAAVSRLASGGNDGVVILWDVVSETGLFRLLGHRGAITDLVFVRLSSGGGGTTTTGGLDALISASLDGLVKVWDIQGQCCIQTIANHRGEVWGADCINVDTTALSSSRRSMRNDREDDASSPARWRLVTGGNDGQVRVWSVQAPERHSMSIEEGEKQTSEVQQEGQETPKAAAAASAAPDDVCRYMGILSPPPNVAASAEKISCVHFSSGGKFVGVLRANSKSVDVYQIRSRQESRKKRQRRLRRRQEKQGKKKGVSSNSETGENTKGGKKRGILDDPESSEDDEGADIVACELHVGNPEEVKPSDEFEYLTSVRASHKIRGFAFPPHREKGELTRIVCALATNSFETHSLVRKKDGDKTGSIVVAERITTMDISGHPTGIRAVTLSSDDSIACTVSKNVTSIWNVESRTCIQSLSPSVLSSSSKGNKQTKASCYGLCAVFLPGNTHVIVGTREGHLIIIDIAAGEVVFSEEGAHDGAIWAIDLRRSTPTSVDSPITIVTGSADKTVKFWILASSEEEQDEEVGSSLPEHPIVVHTRTLQLTDDVVAVRYSHSTDPAKVMVFVSTLDSTIKVFFDDSLKLFLSLYGHKLPALAVDSSDDDVILASSGADKTVKIWGLDFGDTHRTLHGHDDSVTDLRFVKRTHNFFTTCKDGSVRYWDGDRFEQILLLEGHNAEVNCLAVSRTGAFVLSGGMDRQVRVWERTKDIVFLEEERERQLEQMFDKVNDRDQGGTAGILNRTDEESDDGAGANEETPQSEDAVKKSVLSVAAGDRILEGLERADQELKESLLLRKGPNAEKKRQPSPMLLGLEPAHYILWILKSIKSAELEQSLLVLPLSHLERLIYYCTVLLREGRGVEICSRVAVFVVKVHQNQIVTNKSMSTPLRELRRLLRLRLAEARDQVGYNLASMRLIQRIAIEQKQSRGFEDSQPKDIWAGLGLGSDVAAALEGRSKKKR